MDPISVTWGEQKTASEVHKLPCKIEYSGPANVSSMFCVARDGTASFRGRKLVSGEMYLPEGYVGVVMKKSEVTTDSEEQTVTVSSTFDKVTSWGWDAKAGSGSSLSKLVSIQDALHSQ